MTKILFVTTSPRGDASLSTQVARSLVEDLEAEHSGARVLVRDLAAEPLPHLGPDLLGGFFAPADKQSAEQKAAVALSDELIEEIKAADIVVVASAMINFTITSTLKTWLDYLARSGVTFRYNADGTPEGLIKGKKVYVVAATGGVYSATPNAAYDFQVPYLKHMLSFIGLSDIDVVRVEGSIFSPEAAEKAVAEATRQAKEAVTHQLAA